MTRRTYSRPKKASALKAKTKKARNLAAAVAYAVDRDDRREEREQARARNEQ
ncbi:hypothetical protein G6L94_02035 [Agrobacterium rhizogenes]|nr:hypothetical protein [Rhizobium rhizogenes]NTI92459.1 hypothetical protein [Rhizobium rhizogenes]NTJ54926.1 hypothetical protein [Rhizobium rhizogenes]